MVGFLGFVSGGFGVYDGVLAPRWLAWFFGLVLRCVCDA